MNPYPAAIPVLCWLLLLLSPPGASSSVCTAEQALLTTTLTGFTRAKTLLDITPETSGRCEEVRAEVGEPIPADTIFARLDTTFIDLDLQANETALARARNELDFDRKQAARFRKLVNRKASARTRLEELELKLTQSSLRIKELEIQRSRLRETLRRHTLHAPAGWLVTNRRIEPGEWVTPGQPVAGVGDFNQLVLPLSLRAEELAAVQKAKEVSLFLPELGLHGTAVLSRISPDFDPQTRKTRVELSLSKELLAQLPDRRGGLRVEMKLRIRDPMHSLLVPAAALRERYEENWLTRENGKKIRVIVLGPESDPPTGSPLRMRIVSPLVHPGDRFQCDVAPPAPPESASGS